MNIYLVMAKSRVKGTETWQNPYVVYATETKTEAEKDAIRFNKEESENENFLEFNYYVEECKFYKNSKTEE